MATVTHMIHTAEIQRRKSTLDAKLGDLLGASGREDLKIEYQADPLDQVRSCAEREMAVQRIDQHSRMIREVRAALVRLDDGSYGTCECCDAPIPRKRLDVVPWARLCVRCQMEAEAAENEGAPEFEHAA